MVTSECTKEGCLGQGRFVAKDEREALQLAKQKKLRAHCQLCDSWWTLTEEEQLAVEKNLSKSLK
jgi:hypothetical protein